MTTWCSHVIDPSAASRSQGTGAQRAKAWESWWSEQRPSHFNAMLARDRRKAAQAQREAVQRESDAQRSARTADDGATPNDAVRQGPGQGMPLQFHCSRRAMTAEQMQAHCCLTLQVSTYGSGAALGWLAICVL